MTWMGTVRDQEILYRVAMTILELSDEQLAIPLGIGPMKTRKSAVENRVGFALTHLQTGLWLWWKILVVEYGSLTEEGKKHS